MPKYSSYSKSLRAQILDTLHKVSEKARNHEESCRIRKVWTNIPQMLNGNVNLVRECIKSDQMTDRAVCALICMGLEDFSDDLWSIFPVEAS